MSISNSCRLTGPVSNSLDEIHSHSGGECSIRKSVFYIGPVIRKSTFYIIVHAAARSQHAITPPSRGVLPGIWIVGGIHCDCDYCVDKSIQAVSEAEAEISYMNRPWDRCIWAFLPRRKVRELGCARKPIENQRNEFKVDLEERTLSRLHCISLDEPSYAAVK